MIQTRYYKVFQPESPLVTPPSYEDVNDVVNLAHAFNDIKTNRCAGSDGKGYLTYTKSVMENTLALHQELVMEIYRHGAYRLGQVPKKDGSFRPVFISTLKDAQVHYALLRVLERFYEPRFSAHSYGGRKGKSIADAITPIHRAVKQGQVIIVQLDILKLFDNIETDMVDDILARELQDQRLVNLIMMTYKHVEIVDTQGVRYSKLKGIPAGSPLSMLLANRILTEVDRFIERQGYNPYVRWVDDLTLACTDDAHGQQILDEITQFCWEQLRLQVHPDKSHVSTPQESVVLGYTWDKRSRLIPSADNLQSMHVEVQELIAKWVADAQNKHRHSAFKTKLQEKIAGWGESLKLTEDFNTISFTNDLFTQQIIMMVREHLPSRTQRYKFLHTLLGHRTNADKVERLLSDNNMKRLSEEQFMLIKRYFRDAMLLLPFPNQWTVIDGSSMTSIMQEVLA